jgi:chromosome segregation ATPase
MLSPFRWRKQVETRLGELQSELADMQGASEEKESLERRIAKLSQELRQLDEDDEERGTQWLDPETGAAADM